MPNISSHFISPIDLSTLDGIIGVTFRGVSANDFSGRSVASAGDVNGDGFDDLLIGVPFSASGPGLGRSGSTYLVFGHTGAWNSFLTFSNLDGTNGVVINGIAAGDQSGNSVASAGDVNGDGIDDLLIGAPGASPGNFSQAGVAYLIFGHRGTWSSPLVLGSLNGTNGVVINGISANDQSGWSVVGAGDVNGDGISDVLIGASGVSPGNFSQAGSAYLVFGHTGVWSSSLALLNLNGTNGVIMNDIAMYDRRGWSVAGAGDVNGDGIDDLLVGAFSSAGVAGSTYLIFGRTGAWSSPVQLENLNETIGVVINGVTLNDYSGVSVAGAKDVNGDGIDDLLIGAYGASPGSRSQAGSTYLIFGHTGTWSSPLELSSLNGTNGVVINGISASDYSGFSVAGAGDVNRDGANDIVIGAPGFNGCGSSGFIYLIFGHTGIWNSSLALSDLNGINGVIIQGVAANDQSGNSVASAGDVNGDGFDDVVIGAYGADSVVGLANVGSTYLIFGDNLDLLINTLEINQGQTIYLNNSMLAASHPHNLGINANIPFNITNVVHGTFSTVNFLQSAIDASSISFTHDGSIYVPSFVVTVGRLAMVGPVAARINFYASPILYVNPFSVGQGQAIVLTNQTIGATSAYYPAGELIFSVSNVLYGSFIKMNTTITENQFNQSAITLRQITFTTDGSANVPSYDIAVSDGRMTTRVIHGIVNFNAAPILLNNQLTLSPGQQKVILSSNDLSASDAAIPLGDLRFIPSTLDCHFENLNLPGITLPQFEQGNIQTGQILFVWDGHTIPAYNISVSDGILSTSRPASITVTSSNITSVVSTETTNTNAIIGGVAAAGTIGLLFFGLQRYLKKRTNEHFQKVLLEATSDNEKAFNVDVVRPIANKIFNVINTTGFFGQRTEAETKAYMMAIGKIISELRRQNVSLDFNAMEPVDKESCINEIANQTRQQAIPRQKGFFGNCARYFKAEATSQEIEYAAEGIALTVAAWQKRHMTGVSAKSLSLDNELGKQSNTGFSNVAVNENLPTEKGFKFMQNHVKAMEQREQEYLQERKRLEEQSAKQQAELASFRQHGVKILS